MYKYDTIQVNNMYIYLIVEAFANVKYFLLLFKIYLSPNKINVL